MTARIITNEGIREVSDLLVKDARGKSGVEVSARFWGKVDFSNSAGCWPWTGCARGGYGAFQLNGSLRPASRVCWEMKNGPIPDGMVIMHLCDNARCVNPSHLTLGTQRDNIADCVSKGRHHLARQSHCSHGHEYTPENTYRHPTTGGRCCRICRKREQVSRNVGRGR